MTRSVATHCQEQGNQIRSNSILPGTPETPMTAAALSALDPSPAGHAGWAAITIYHGSAWFILAMMLGLGLGKVIAAAAVPVLVLDAVPPERTSEATVVITSTRPVAMSIGIQISSYLLASSMISDPSQGPDSYPTAQAFFWTFCFITLACLLCCVCVWALPGKRAKALAAASAQNLVR